VPGSLATRRPKLSPVAAVLATAVFLVAIVLTATTPMGYVVAIPVVVLASIVSVVRLGFRQSQLARVQLELEGNRLWQIDRSGAVVAEIDLAAPYTYEFLDRQNGFAIYQLRQDKAVLEFTSDAPAAREVITFHLGLEWPPTDRSGLTG
jgi:hypothetical protein